MKPVNDPNRQQPAQIRPVGLNVVRTTTTPMPMPPGSVATTNVTSHIVSTGNPPLTTIKTIPVSTARVMPHSSSTTLTMVGSGTSTLRPVSASANIGTSFHMARGPATIASISTPRSAVTNPLVRNITPMITTSGAQVTPSFVSSLRPVARLASGIVPASGTGSAGWSSTIASKPGGASASTGKLPSGIPIPVSSTGYPITSAPRAPVASLTVTTRPVLTTSVRPELATLRTTKSTIIPDKFVRAPGRATLAFAAPPGQSGQQFQTSGSQPLTHLALTTIPTNQSSNAGTALTLQPIVVGATASGAKAVVGGARQGSLHPIGPKVITQPAHGPALQITHLAGVASKPSVQSSSSSTSSLQNQPTLQLARAPSQSSTSSFSSTNSGPTPTSVKVLTQAPPGLLQDVVLSSGSQGTLTQQGGTATALLPTGSVFIQTAPHTSVNMAPLERGTVVTSSGYSLPAGYYYDASSGGGGLITAAPPHTPITHGTTQHQLIATRTFSSNVTQGGVTAMHVQSASFQSCEEVPRKTFTSNMTTTSVSANIVGGRFNPVMVVEANNRPSLASAGHHSEAKSEQPGVNSQQQQQQQQQLQGSHVLGSTTPASQPSQQQHNQPQQANQSQLQHSQSQLQHNQPQHQHSQPQPQQQQHMSQAQSSGPQQPLQQQQHPGSSQQTLQPIVPHPLTPSTPSKPSASPRPSILRKRDNEGTPLKAQKNLGPVLAAIAASTHNSSLPSSTHSSPPPSPPARPDSTEDHGKDGHGGHSSAGSSTISATSSPGLPCDGDNNGMPQLGMMVKTEPMEMGDGASSTNGTNGNSEIMSPRKKPRKQQLTGNELHEPLYCDETVDFLSDDKNNKDGNDVNHRQDGSQETSHPSTPIRTPASIAARRRPSVSLLQAYRTCWKPLNHFLRPSDVRAREERRPNVSEISSQRRVLQRARGWKLHHLSTQMDEMAERETDVLGQLSEVLTITENPSTHSGSGEPTDKDLNRTSELIRSNIQRSKVVRDQLEECRSQLLRLLDHTTPVVDIIKRNANRRQAKKKY